MGTILKFKGHFSSSKLRNSSFFHGSIELKSFAAVGGACMPVYPENCTQIQKIDCAKVDLENS